MGTWNYGPFDNDKARDVVRQLADGTFRLDQFRFDCADEPLDSERAEAVVALVAVMNGHLPAEADRAALSFPFDLSERRWLQAKLRETLNPENSELYEQWRDAGELEQWLAATEKVAH
ncbi:hypothetical protein CAPI_06040 [Corynebacterium capitovis DSM 44611]|uniref:DUF4259 domain-containing protein n=1 Tax=Corynebacterium capitovis TaxID=131081 RepID=UPI000365026F|nr:DUF4259 domain-containing protein [Corynebacterium capitovis]WKD57753.1 hypothetical protein CAPI_06040 [Corynebacterium capitovis DSM 44611]